MTGAPRPGATLRLLPSTAQQRANVLLLCRADLRVSQKTLNPNQMFKAPYKSDPDTRADSPSLCCVLQTHRNRRGTRALVPQAGEGCDGRTPPLSKQSRACQCAHGLAANTARTRQRCEALKWGDAGPGPPRALWARAQRARDLAQPARHPGEQHREGRVGQASQADGGPGQGQGWGTAC